jgi:hypothetical protein
MVRVIKILVFMVHGPFTRTTSMVRVIKILVFMVHGPFTRCNPNVDHEE